MAKKKTARYSFACPRSLRQTSNDSSDRWSCTFVYSYSTRWVNHGHAVLYSCIRANQTSRAFSDRREGIARLSRKARFHRGSIGETYRSLIFRERGATGTEYQRRPGELYSVSVRVHASGVSERAARCSCLSRVLRVIRADFEIVVHRGKESFGVKKETPEEKIRSNVFSRDGSFSR